MKNICIFFLQKMVYKAAKRTDSIKFRDKFAPCKSKKDQNIK